MPALTKTSSSRPTPPWRPHNRNSPPQQGKGDNTAAAMTPACPKLTKNQSYAEPVQLSRPEYPSQSPTHHADTQISPITLKSSASKTPREKSGFTAHAVRDWLGRIGVKTLYIEPGSPWENGYNESFNSKLRDEILNTEIFSTLKEAKVLIERWRHHYNTIRPHSSLGYRPPAPETILPNVDGPTYAVDGLRLDHQLNPRQTLT